MLLSLFTCIPRSRLMSTWSLKPELARLGVQDPSRQFGPRSERGIWTKIAGWVLFGSLVPGENRFRSILLLKELDLESPKLTFTLLGHLCISVLSQSQESRGQDQLFCKINASCYSSFVMEKWDVRPPTVQCWLSNTALSVENDGIPCAYFWVRTSNF